MRNDLTKYCYKNENTEGWLNHLKVSHYCNSKLTSEVEENALCIPDQGKLGECFMGGIYTNEGEPVELSFQRNGFETAKKLIQKTDLSNVKFEDKKVVYLGQYRVHYGSFLVDSISRLWYTLDDPQNYQYVFLATQTVLGTSLHKSAVDFFNLLGISESQITIITEPTRYRKIIIPEEAYTPLKEYHPEFLDIIRKVVRSASVEGIKPTEKVYFSRSKFAYKLKSDFGEEFIAELFRCNGFEVIYPEEHSLAEQIFYVNNCKVFASIGGSCAHNILFSLTKPKMILLNRMNGYQFHQWFLNEMAGVEPITYVDAYTEPFKKVFKTEVTGPFLYWCNTNVKKFAKDYGMIIPRYSFWKKARCMVRYVFYFAKKQVYIMRNRIGKI